MSQGGKISDHVAALRNTMNVFGDQETYVWTVFATMMTGADRDLVSLFIISQIKIAHERTCDELDHSRCAIAYTNRGRIDGDAFSGE